MCATKQISVLLIAFVTVLLLSACAMDAGPQPKSKLDASAVTAVSVKSDAEENITDLTEVLDCVGTQVATFGSKKFYLGNDRIINESGEKSLPESGRTMLQSAFATLVEKSNGKVIWSGFSSALIGTQVVNQFRSEIIADQKLKTKDTPEFIVSGAITQFEKNIQKATRDQDVKILGSGIGQSDGANLSIIGTNLTLHSTTSGFYSIYKGIQSNNVISIKGEDDATGIFLGSSMLAGVGLNLAFMKKEGVSAALMKLMQLGAIEITGKYYKDDFDYRQCLSPDQRQKILSSLTATNKQVYYTNPVDSMKAMNMRFSSNADNQGYFQHGQALQLGAITNDNGYLTCYYSMANGKSVKIFPNKYVHDNLIEEKQFVNIPGDDRLKVVAEKLPSNVPREKIACIFSRANPATFINSMIGTSPTDKYSLKDVYQSIGSNLPANSYVVNEFDILVR